MSKKTVSEAKGNIACGGRSKSVLVLLLLVFSVSLPVMLLEGLLRAVPELISQQILVEVAKMSVTTPVKEKKKELVKNSGSEQKNKRKTT